MDSMGYSLINVSSIVISIAFKYMAMYHFLLSSNIVLPLHWIQSCSVSPCCSCNFFPKFLKILDPPCWFYLSWFYWFPELGCSFATNLDFPEIELSSIVYHFRRMNDRFLSTNDFDCEVWSFWLMDWFPLSLSEFVWTVNRNSSLLRSHRCRR